MSKTSARAFFTLARVSIAFWILAALVMIAMEWAAESFLPVWILLFVPPLFLLVPFGFLVLCSALMRRWRWAAAHFVVLCLVLFGFYRWRLPNMGPAPEGGFTVITHNIGQGNKQAFSNAFPEVTPDAVLLQDAVGRERDYARRFPKYRARGIGQFVLLTPHEIVAADLVKDALWRGKPIAARYVIRLNGREVALYNVHLPTPRASLRHVFSPRVGLEMLWVADAPTDDHPSYREWLRARVELARQLAAVFSKEVLPFIVSGDFNTPDHGRVYHSISDGLCDSHAVAGSGWGFTFPGDGRKGGVLSWVFGPWLRLDYVFAGNGFNPVECRVGPNDSSQHRAVYARLAPLF